MSNNSIIKETVLNVTQRFLKQESKTNRKLDSILNKKFEKVEFNEDKYIDLLKYNVLFYKTLSRNTEPIISKWILEKYIPEIDELESDIELINARCRKYINNAKKNGIESFKEADLQSFVYYDKMSNADKIKRLQKDYKVLNIYMEVLSMTLRELSLKREDSIDLFLLNPADARIELKREIIVIVNRILAGGHSKSEEKSQVEQKPSKETYSKDEFEKKIRQISDAEIMDCINEEFKRIKLLENISSDEAFGVGGVNIYDFAAATVLLDYVKGKERAIIEGAMRLTVSGEFGEENFAEFMKAVSKKENTIDPKVWDEAVLYLRNNKKCLESSEIAVTRRSVPADIDIEEYIYMLENADKSEPFRNRMTRKIDLSMIIPRSVKNSTQTEKSEDKKDEATDNIENADYDSEENISEETDLDEEINKEDYLKIDDKSEVEDKTRHYEIHIDPEKRKESFKAREIAEIKESETEEEKEIENAVVRAKRAVENIKEDIAKENEKKHEDDDIYKFDDENEDDSTLDAIAKLASSEDEEEDEPEVEVVERKGFSLFGRKNKKSEEEEEFEEEEFEDDEEYDEEEYYEEDDEIEEESVPSSSEMSPEDKKKRRKLDIIVAILILAVAIGGYALIVNKKKKEEALKQEQIKQEQQIEAEKKREEERKQAEEQKIAEEQEKRNQEMEKVKDSGEYYRVYAGSMKKKEEADELIKQLEAKGFSGDIIHIGNYYKAFVGGDIGVYSEAQKQMNALKAKGFRSYIEKYDKYCDLKIEDFRLRAEYMNKEEIEQEYNKLKEELSGRKNFTDYEKILQSTYDDLIAQKSE